MSLLLFSVTLVLPYLAVLGEWARVERMGSGQSKWISHDIWVHSQICQCLAMWHCTSYILSLSSLFCTIGVTATSALQSDRGLLNAVVHVTHEHSTWWMVFNKCSLSVLPVIQVTTAHCSQITLTQILLISGNLNEFTSIHSTSEAIRFPIILHLISKNALFKSKFARNTLMLKRTSKCRVCTQVFHSPRKCSLCLL